MTQIENRPLCLLAARFALRPGDTLHSANALSFLHTEPRVLLQMHPLDHLDDLYLNASSYSHCSLQPMMTQTQYVSLYSSQAEGNSRVSLLCAFVCLYRAEDSREA